jgi:beta-glucosidase
MQKLLLRSFLIGIALWSVSPESSFSQNKKSKVTPGSTSKDEAKIEAILKKLTLEEKVGQMTQITLTMLAENTWSNTNGKLDMAKVNEFIHKYKVGSFLNSANRALTLDEWHSILKILQEETMKESHQIPMVYGLDAIHGQTYTVNSTLFPHNIAMAATRNPALVRDITKITAKELRASGTRWNFAPVLDCGRNPLWSRQAETYGEDPFLGGLLGIAAIKAYEEDGLKNQTAVASCMKHFIGYSNPRSGKDRTPTMMPEIELREYYLPQFKAAVEAGSSTIMINSGELNGVPVHVSKYLLQDVLRKELGFKGLVVTDWEDINRLYIRHRVAATPREAVVQAINAGIDMSMVPYDADFCPLLIEAVKKGEVSMSRIDDAVRNVLAFKMKLGLFDNPYVEFDAVKNFNLPEYQTVALEAAREAMTLLKNQKNTLPLGKKQKILLAGPGANNYGTLNGAWSYMWQGDVENLYPSRDLTIAQAIEAKIGKENLINLGAKGYKSYENYDGERLKAEAANASAIILCLGENAYAETPGNINDLTLDANQLKLAEAAILTGKPVILVLTEGRPRIISSIEPGINAILQAYWSGSNTAKAVADVLFGDYNPNGRLPYTYPRNTNALHTYDFKLTELPSEVYPEGIVPMNATNPQFAFGTGLSYTTFKYSNLKLSQSQLNGQEKMRVSLMVTNSGAMAGKHSVELYSRDLFASITPSNRRLRGVQKIELGPNQSKEVVFEITAEDLSFINEKLERVTENGEFDVIVGDLSARFTYRN